MTHESSMRALHEFSFKLLAFMVVATGYALLHTCMYAVLHWRTVADPFRAVVVAALQNSRFDYIRFNSKLDGLMEALSCLIPLMLLVSFAVATKVRTTRSKRTDL